MFVMARTHNYLILAAGLAFLGVGTGNIEAAVCDIQTVCGFVEEEKKDKDQTLERETIKKIKKKCDRKPVVLSTCPMKKVIKLCWDPNNSTAVVVAHCKEE